jgi:hypothetical protein
VGVKVSVEVATLVAVVVIGIVGVTLAPTGFGWLGSDALAEVNSNTRARARSRQAPSANVRPYPLKFIAGFPYGVTQDGWNVLAIIFAV